MKYVSKVHNCLARKVHNEPIRLLTSQSSIFTIYLQSQVLLTNWEGNLKSKRHQTQTIITHSLYTHIQTLPPMQLSLLKTQAVSTGSDDEIK